MSYSKLEIRYLTDGCNSQANVNTREGEKYRTLAMPKKVQEYGNEHGYSAIKFDFSGDHLILKGGDEVLMDMDINGTNNNEYITEIVSYTWID